MIDYAQSFDQFAGSLKPMDLALYAGAGLVLWVLFKDRLSPVQEFVLNLVNKIKGSVNTNKIVEVKPSLASPESNDIFFQLVTSWKQTRDLAVKGGCSEAVKVADQMFPYLSPTGCGEEKV